MIEEYKELIELQIETVGATFIMGYSVKSKKHFIVFNNQGKRIESDNPISVINLAIEYIKKKRKEHPYKKEQTFTLFNYY